MSGEPRARMMGLDVGTKRIGVALSDELGMIASPETTFAVAAGADGEDAARAAVVALARSVGVGRVVVGMPRNMRGERGIQAVWTQAFVVRLRGDLRTNGIAVSTYDERLTSVEAERADRAMGGTAKKRRADPLGRTSLDARAAALVLQGYLDRQRAAR